MSNLFFDSLMPRGFDDGSENTEEVNNEPSAIAIRFGPAPESIPISVDLSSDDLIKFNSWPPICHSCCLLWNFM